MYMAAPFIPPPTSLRWEYSGYFRINLFIIIAKIEIKNGGIYELM
jgi:hypothetical protein